MVGSVAPERGVRLGLTSDFRRRKLGGRQSC
jgi:hypothetical protein